MAKSPDRIAVMVSHFADGDHLELWTEAEQCFLLNTKKTPPRVGELVILQNTRKRPTWYKQARKQNAVMHFYSYDGSDEEVWIWKVEKDNG